MEVSISFQKEALGIRSGNWRKNELKSKISLTNIVRNSMTVKCEHCDSRLHIDDPIGICMKCIERLHLNKLKTQRAIIDMENMRKK